MKTLTALLAFAPVAAFAHGGHPQMAPPSHDWFHISPLAALLLAVLGIGIVVLRGRGS